MESSILQLTATAPPELLETLKLVADQQKKTNELLHQQITLGDPARLMTQKEAAQYMQCSYSKIQQLMDAGQLDVYRIGNKKYFRRNHLDAWLETQKTRKQPKGNKTPSL